MSRKLPHQISTEDLLESLENNTEPELKTIDFEYKNDVPQFLSHFKLEAGPYPVKKYLFKRLYAQYSKNRVDGHEFGISMCTFVNHDINNYFLNKPQIEILNLLVNKRKRKIITHLANPKVIEHFEKFLTEIDVKKGNKWVKVKYLRFLYNKYVKEKRTKSKFSYPKFTKIVRLYFEFRQTGHHSVFIRVSEDFINKFTKEELEEIKNGEEKKK